MHGIKQPANNLMRQKNKHPNKVWARNLKLFVWVCAAAFFIQAEEEDEKNLYILLAVVLAVAGAINLVRRLWLTHKRREGKNGHEADLRKEPTTGNDGN
jgi:hypothetical protein